MADLNIVLTVKSINKIAQDYYSIAFGKPKKFIYEPGNWMDIRFPTPEFPVGHTYSFASSPIESDVMIAFKKGVSTFKKALEQVKTEDTMLITQYGSNGFLLNKKYQSLFIAGGIGITPFRSMIKEAIDTNSKVPITLIYLNHTQEFPFNQELDEWVKSYQHLTILYFSTLQYGRLTHEKLLKLIPNIADYMCYVAGSPGMVKSIENILQNIGSNKEDIKIDSFDGY